MIKYLAKKNHKYWYRRKINKFGEILLSLKTKNYDIAILRYSYIDFKIKELIYKGAFHTMTVQEIRALIDKYKIYILLGTSKNTKLIFLNLLVLKCLESWIF